MFADCAGFHSPQSASLTAVFSKKSKTALKNLKRMLKALSWLGYMAQLFAVFGGTALAHFVEQADYPLPFLSVLPVYGRNTYILVFIHQFWATNTATNGLITIAQYMFTSFVYTFSHIGALEEIIVQMNPAASAGDYELWKKNFTDLVVLIKE